MQTSSIATTRHDFEEYGLIGWCGGKRMPGKNSSFDEIHLPGGMIGLISIQRSPVNATEEITGLYRSLAVLETFPGVTANPQLLFMRLLRQPGIEEVCQRLFREKKISLRSEIGFQDLRLLIGLCMLERVTYANNVFEITPAFDLYLQEYFNQK